HGSGRGARPDLHDAARLSGGRAVLSTGVSRQLMGEPHGSLEVLGAVRVPSAELPVAVADVCDYVGPAGYQVGAVQAVAVALLVLWVGG
ncbi:hypothetical protein ACM9HB_35535, partial [Streptomyces sp. JAC128]